MMGNKNIGINIWNLKRCYIISPRTHKISDRTNFDNQLIIWKWNWLLLSTVSLVHLSKFINIQEGGGMRWKIIKFSVLVIEESAMRQEVMTPLGHGNWEFSTCLEKSPTLPTSWYCPVKLVKPPEL